MNLKIFVSISMLLLGGDFAQGVETLGGTISTPQTGAPSPLDQETYEKTLRDLGVFFGIPTDRKASWYQSVGVCMYAGQAYSNGAKFKSTKQQCQCNASGCTWVDYE